MQCLQFNHAYLADNDGVVEGVFHDGAPSIRFEDIIAFATGATSEPPIGFENEPTISFQTKSPYPRANTCANVIYLPCKHYMTYGVLNTAGFGQV